MHPQIKQQWVEALRSGEYVQGSGALRDARNRFCVNGVLCDLHAKAHGYAWYKRHGSNDWYYNGLNLFPGEKVREWAQIEADSLLDTECHNDHGEEFISLAQWIDDNL